MDYSLYVRKKLEPYKDFGMEELGNGTELIGRAKFIAPLAYLHSLYPPLNEQDILFIEDKLKILLPEAMKDFYRSFNGLNLFITSLNIYGLRKNTSRAIDASRQPFDIFTPNIDERIIDAGDNILFIGGYNWDHSKLYIDINTEKVFFCSSESITPLLQWDSFEEMIISEFNRLINLHTVEGKNIPLKPTVPLGGEDVLLTLIERARSSKKPPYWYNETIKE